VRALPCLGPVEALLRCGATLLIVGLFLYHANAQAQDGALDSTFGFLGRQSFAFPNFGEGHVFASSELSDGRIVVAGTCGSTTCIARLRSNGSFDPTFGPQGFGYVRFDQIAGTPPGNTLGFDMAVLADGRMAVLGALNGDLSSSLLIYLVKADGTALDTSNGGSGFLGYPFGSRMVYTCACRIIAQADGALISIAAVEDVSGIITGVSRVLPNIRGLDESFGTQGVTTIVFNIQGPVGGNTDSPAAIALQADGKILIGVNGLLANYASGLEFARLLTNGQRDMTFGTNGDGRFVLTDPAHSLMVTNIVADSRQRLVFAASQENGVDEIGTDFNAMVGRLTSSGVLDTSFNGSGTYAFQPIGTSGRFQSVQSVAVTSDSIIAASQVPRTVGDEFTYFAVTRLNTNGSPSAAFGGAGTVYFPFISNSVSDRPATVLVTKLGIFVSGDTRNAAGDSIIGVARLQYDHVFADSFQ
jgi:uncharacterized delta-60 repeat protein